MKRFQYGASLCAMVLTLSCSPASAAASLSSSAASMDFGSVEVGSSARRAITISNTGKTRATRVWTTLLASDEVSLVSNSCGTNADPITLRPGESCALTFAYSPSEPSMVGSVTLSYRSGRIFRLLSLALAGVGVQKQSQVQRPSGIFVLDSMRGTFRDANIRSYDFIRGYAWRYPWDAMESAPGVYDFTAVDHILSKLAPLNQKLSMILLPGEPAYIRESGQAELWDNGARSRPWDVFTLERFAAFLHALSEHRVPDPARGNDLVALRDHSLFYMLNITLPGMPNGGIRDRGNQARIVDINGYSRDAFIERAVIGNLMSARAAFPDSFISVGFWSSIANDGGAPELWTAIRERFYEEFEGDELGVFMDNLAASRECAGCAPYIGFPVVEYGQSLHTMQSRVFTGFQALGPWALQDEKVRFGTPMDGLDHGHRVYSAKYFEIYVADIDRTEWHAGFSEWADLLEDE